MTVRSEVAAAIAQSITDVTVYDYDPDVVSLPAIIVSPGSPYIVPDAMTQRRWALDIVILLVPLDERSAPSEIESLVERVIAVLETMPAITWSEVSPPGPAEAGQQSCIAATISTSAWRA
jgi:hypothetical protein